MTRRVEPILLDHRVDLYVPSQCICASKLPGGLRSRTMEEVKGNFDKWFGSHSEILIKGDWPLPDGTMAREEVADIFSFCTAEALEQHQEDVDHLAVDIANRLTQDRVLRVFDNLKVALWPNTLENLVPKKNCACHGGATASAGVMVQPLDIGKADRLSKMLIIQGILRSFNSAEHARKLFCDVLNYNYGKGELPWAKWPDSVRPLLIDAPTILADHNDFKILYLRTSANELRRGAGRQVIQRIYKDDPTFRGLIVISDQPQKSWELVNVKVHSDDSNRLVLRRMRVGVEAVRTATERLATLEIGEAEDASIAPEELHKRLDQAFDVEAVTKAFFADVANWYFWALRHVHFPKDAPKEEDGHDHVSVIRLITRLIFCWFVKEKGLIPADLFNERKLGDLLVGFCPGKVSNKNSVFYKAILQNLFFATLNTEMDKRSWRRNGQNFMAHSLYRHKNLFIRPDESLHLFKNIPFLNGGLFECLDKILGDKDSPHYERIDGFSDRADSQPTVPDFLFFGEEREVDLSEDYGDKKFKKVKVRGLIHTLNHYHFTVEESTPLEEEVALDPELAGKIFENLLAAYNPETGATARKQTGSFYTPREIVNHMVDEALIAYLKGKVEGAFPEATDIELRLRHLFSYEEEGHRFKMNEVEVLISAIDQLKALDPAVGSGAFPMGILHKLVFILGRLDPRNEKWKERQKERLQDAMKTAERIEDATIRENTLHELEQQLYGIDEAFEKNTLDYGRKLYLIENCLYGVDIQSIAVQIAKMRFFISLVADQKVDPSAENFGVRALPNLETKLVAANTLIGIDKPQQMKLRNPRIDALEGELRRVRERHFLAKTPTAKAKCREQDKKLRNEIAELLRKDGWGDKTAKQLAGWDPYDQNASSGFFDLEWMFGVQDGFDVVIANPPYIDSEAMTKSQPDFRDLYATLFDSARGNWDLFIVFIEQGIRLLSNHGMQSYIVPNKLIGAPYSEALRKIFLHHAFLEIRDYSSVRVFKDSDVYPVVFVLEKSGKRRDVLMTVMSDLTKTLRTNRIPPEVFYASIYWDRYFEDPRILDMLAKFAEFPKLGVFLKDIYGAATVSEAYEIKKLIKEHTGKEMKPFRRLINTGTIDRYCSLWSSYPTQYIKNRYTAPIVYDGELGRISETRLQQAKAEKIIIGGMTKVLECFYDKGEYLAGKSTTIILGDGKLNLKYLTGILNSALVSFWYRIYYKSLTLAGGYLRISNNEISSVPIPESSLSRQKGLVSLVERIQAAKKKDPSADTAALEREADEIVYRHYGLTKAEIIIVEGGR